MRFMDKSGITGMLANYFGLITLFFANICWASTIVIGPKTVIFNSTTWNNVTLDMTHGNIIVTNNAKLTITNSTINGTLSKKNAVLFNVDKGSMELVNNQIHIQSNGIDPHPGTQSLQHVIQLATASFKMDGNIADIDKSRTSGFLITTPNLPTTGIQVTNNKFVNFHGVLYLLATDSALVQNNTFYKNSYGHIVLIGSNSKILDNVILFSGLNNQGDGIDIIDSNGIMVSNNILLTPSCRGIYLFNSQDINVNKNRIFGGITYGINIVTFPETLSSDDKLYLESLIGNHQLKNMASSNISITNNLFSQNRYGIMANDTNGLQVMNNVFIQRFKDATARKFWTDNNILMHNVTNLTWNSNLYKEAFTQDTAGDNSKSFQTVPFPQSGGVSL